VLRHGRVWCLQVILTPTCHVSSYPRQVIEVDASWTTTLFLAALTTVTTLITIIPLGTYTSSSWYIFLWDDATPLVHLSSLMTAVCLSLLSTKLLCWTASLLDTVCTALTAFHYFSTLTSWLECSLIITLGLPNRSHRFQPFGCCSTCLTVVGAFSYL
jgi:hypothetical protein